MSFWKKPGVLTGALLVILLGFLYFRSHGWKLPPAALSLFSRQTTVTPQDAVYGMLDAARAGNTSVYVDAFSGPLQQQVQQVVREGGKAQFASYLTRQSASFQSVALSVTDQPSDVEARVRVEYVYVNRNEVQVFHLRKLGSRWKIVGVSSTDLTKTLIPWGTAVTD
jgi:hypothetical protein